MPFTCWSCEEEVETRSDLRNHYMRLPHKFLEVVCAWCTGKKEVFRRPVDLRLHITDRHRDLRKEGKDFPTDAEAFFLATKPRAYVNSSAGRPADSTRVPMIKEAVLGNPVLGPADDWQKGWERHGQASGSYSPSRPSLWSLDSLSLDPEGGKVIVSGGVGEILRFTIPCQDHRTRESLLRMMGMVKPGMEIPNSWTISTSSNASTILAAVGLPNMKVGKVERNAWSPEIPSPKRQRTAAPLSPLTPLATPQHEPELEEPPFCSPRLELPNPPSVSPDRQITQAITRMNYTPTPKGDAASLPPPSTTENPPLPPPKEANQNAQLTPSSDIKSRALHLLQAGGMPLFPPARRNWTGESSIRLPLQGSFETWPPAGWQQMPPDTRLLLWEAVSTTLAWKFDLGLDRQTALDSFQFLALPGSKDPITDTPEGRMRHGNYRMIRKIALGQKVVAAEAILQMFEKVSNLSNMPEGYKELLVLASNIKLRV